MAQHLRIGLAINHALAYYRGILRGIRHYAETRPHWVFNALVIEEGRRRSTSTSQPDGVIASINTPELANSMRRWPRPVVNVSAVVPDLRFPNVRVNNDLVGQLAAQHFLDRGLRHFAFVGQVGQLVSDEREVAFRKALAAGGHPLACYHDRATRPFDPSGRRWPLDRGVLRWLRSLSKPIGILAQNDLWGMRLAEACRQIDMRVPEDVALLGVDNDDLYCELSRPTLSSVVLPSQRIGVEAAALLERLLEGAPPPAEPILMPPVGIVTRRSTEVLAIDDADVVAAVRLIRESAHVPLRASDVLKEVQLGRRTLERRFRQHLGRGVSEEIRRVHLERARRLLIETTAPMKSIAQQAGFSDFRHMAVVFRQELGMSPSKYRKQFKDPSTTGQQTFPT
jgi:LacI family transcriptional regulator